MNSTLVLEHQPGLHQLADVLTKPVAASRMSQIMEEWGLRRAREVKAAVIVKEEDKHPHQAPAEEAAASNKQVTSKLARTLERVMQLMTSCGLVCGVKGEAQAGSNVKEALESDWDM